MRASLYPFGLTTTKIANNSVRILLFHWWYIYDCDIVIYNKKYILSLPPCLGTKLLKQLLVMRAIKVFCDANEAFLGKHLWLESGCQWSQPVIRGLGLSLPLLETGRA